MTGPGGDTAAQRGGTAAQQDRARRQQTEARLLARWGESKIGPSRHRIDKLMDVLGQPQRSYRSIHLTGTNGKTSTARMVDELLRGFGLRTGRYTSPHLSQITERIVLDGQPVADATFADGYAEIEPYLEMVDADSDIPMTFFEAVTGLAFAIFADAPVDVAVVEVGLGGEWDATNVLDSAVAVITPIDLDHTELLGETTAEIAREKAGIITAGATAILAAQPADAAAELLRRAAEVGATVAREGLEFGVLERSLAVGGQLIAIQGLGGVYPELFLPLHGAYQAQNAACALAAVEAFFGAGAAAGPLDLEVVRAAFAAVRSPGRLEPVRSAPTVLVDASHNPAGMRATVEALVEGFDFRQLVGVVAMLARKDVRTALEILEPVLAEVVVSQNSSSRAIPADELAAVAVDIFGTDRVTVEPRLDDALETAVRLAEDGADGLLVGAGVLVTGSVVTAGEARTLLGAPEETAPGRRVTGPAAGSEAGPEGVRETAGPDMHPETDLDAEAELAERRRRADRATRGALAGLLCLEAFVVLLVPRAIAQTSQGLSTTTTVLLIALAVLLVGSAFVLRRPWGIGLGSGLQVLVAATVLLIPVLAVVIVLFVLLWWYVLRTRRQLLATPSGWRMLIS